MIRARETSRQRGQPPLPNIAQMGTAELQFEVTDPIKNNFSLTTYFRNMFRPRFGGGFESYTSARGPSVLAKNPSGEECVIEVTKTMEEAQQRAVTIEQDYRRLSTEDWCSRYNVPVSFVSER
jgi:hypothetical protein